MLKPQKLIKAFDKKSPFNGKATNDIWVGEYPFGITTLKKCQKTKKV